MADEQSLLESLLNMSLRSACYNDKVFFFGNKEEFGTTSSSIRLSEFLDYRTSGLQNFTVHLFYLHYVELTSTKPFSHMRNI
jgi:hypothetical protein